MMLYGERKDAGLGSFVRLAEMDFETYSEAGYAWNEIKQSWVVPEGINAKEKGLGAVGAANYAMHPSTEILSLAYDLADHYGAKLWVPGDPPPVDLFRHIAAGKLIEAHNSGFEWWIWNYVGVLRYGWPALPINQLRCSMAKCHAFGLPGGLAKVGEVLNTEIQKDKEGTRLLDKFSKPRNPTKKDPRRRIRPSDDPLDAKNLYRYNTTDILAENEISQQCPNLTGTQLKYFLLDQKINRRGVYLDIKSVDNLISLIEPYSEALNLELPGLTNGAVEKASEVQAITRWLAQFNIYPETLDDDAVSELLQGELPAQCRRVLEIRQALCSAAVKKLYSMRRYHAPTGRCHDLFIFHKARTGRAGGQDIQPHNFPNSGPKMAHCSNCNKHFRTSLDQCPWCRADTASADTVEWNPDAVEDALQVAKTRDHRIFEHMLGSPITVGSACLRGMFCAAPGTELIGSDYSAIEAVVAAMLAGETWRIEVFRTHGRIYEASASKITGIPFEEFMICKGYTPAQLAEPEWWKLKPENPGKDHPARKETGKPMELACGYGGWINGAKQFGADKYLDDEGIKKAILAWRETSPAIVEMWGGQMRGRPWQPDCRMELYGLEGAIVQAIQNPGTWFGHRGIEYTVWDSVLYCKLLSGRLLTYHKPKLYPGKDGIYEIWYEGWNTNQKKGPVGWIPMKLYGGLAFENVDQATAFDIMAYGSLSLEDADYPIVLHVHDEIVSEVPKGFGSIEEFERIMSTMPTFAADWPIRASGGWRGHRYRK